MRNLFTTIILITIAIGCSNEGKINDNHHIEIIPEDRLTEYEVVRVENDDFNGFKYSEKFFDWKNPTTGGALHINQNDEIELYLSFHWLGSKESRFFQKISTDIEDFHLYINGIGLGNAPSVLLTSEFDISKSKSFDEIMTKLKKKAYMIYCVK